MTRAVDVDVAVIGGGVAGAAAACAFGAAGLRVAVLERRRAGHDANRGDALHRSVVAPLERWGALAELERRGAFWVRQVTFTAPRGRPSVRVRLDRNPLLMLAHADIELGLAAAALRHGADLRATAVAGLERDGPGWALRCGDGLLRARLVVGADGGGSLARRAAGIGVARRDYGESTVVLHAPRPPWLEADAGWAMVHPEGSVLILPTTPAGSCRVVALVRTDQLAAWRGASEDELAARLAGRGAMLRGLEVRRAAGSHVYHLARQHAERYWAPGLALVGDSAHVVHPGGGQGMALAVHDVAALAEQALPALRAGGSAELSAALERYQRRRRGLNARAIARADRSARLTRPGARAYAASRLALAACSLAPGLLARVYQRFGEE